MLFIAISDEMMPPGSELALCIEAALQAYHSAGAEGVVGNVVFARPEQLDRRVNPFGDPCGLDQIVVLQRRPKLPPERTM
jgi:hypothetical protein